MATHFSILAWRSLSTVHRVAKSIGLQRVRHDQVTEQQTGETVAEKVRKWMWEWSGENKGIDLSVKKRKQKKD